MEEKYNTWNEKAKSIDKKIVSRKFDIAKTLLSIAFLIVFFGFLVIFSLRTYYYDLYRDLITTTQLCNPMFNTTTKCGDVNVDCKCMNKEDLKYLLDDVCPEELNIKIYQNNS